MSKLLVHSGWRGERLKAGLCTCTDCGDYCRGDSLDANRPFCYVCESLCDRIIALCWRCRGRASGFQGSCRDWRCQEAPGTFPEWVWHNTLKRYVHADVA